MRAVPAICVTLVLLTCGAAPARSDWPSSPSANLPVCTASSYQGSPRLVSDDAGGFVAVWSDERCCGQGAVYAQRVGPTGAMLWTGNGIPVATVASYKQYIGAATDGAHGAIVSWVDDRSGASLVYAQHVTASGTAAWTPDGVALGSPAGYQDFLSACADGSGGEFLVWRMWLLGPQRYQVFAQHVDGAGIAHWNAGGLAVSPQLVGTLAPTIAPDDSGGIILSWTEGPLSGSNYELRAQRVDANGLLRWDASGALIRTAPSHRPLPVALGVPGGAIIGWNEISGVLAQRVGLDGAPLWSIPPVVTGNISSSQYPVAVKSGKDGVVLGWIETRGSFTRAYAQRLNGLGAAHWLAGGVAVCDSAYPVGGMVACSDNEDGAIFAWSDPRDVVPPQGFYYDIYGGRITGSGTPAWDTHGVAISNAHATQADASIAVDGIGGALIAWCDQRNGTPQADIYAQNLRHDGTRGGSLLDVPASGIASSRFAVLPATPNPARGADVMLRFSLSRAQRGTVTLFDLSGRPLRRWPAESFPAGTASIRWNGLDDGGRPASPGLYWIVLEGESGRASGKLAIIR